jgi:5-methylcytosine-specific restriction endonuclease McrA
MKDQKNPFYGRHHTKTVKLHLSQIMRDKYKNSDQHPPNWKGGRSSHLNRRALERDNFTCQDCGLYDPEIVLVDHIKTQRDNPELKYDLKNLKTLCPNCHAKKSFRNGETVSKHKTIKRRRFYWLKNHDKLRITKSK